MYDSFMSEYNELYAKLLAGIATENEAIRFGRLEEIYKTRKIKIPEATVLTKIQVVAQEFMENRPFTNEVGVPRSMDDFVEGLIEKHEKEELDPDLLDAIYYAVVLGHATYIDIGKNGNVLFLSQPYVTPLELNNLVRSMDLTNTEWEHRHEEKQI